MYKLTYEDKTTVLAYLKTNAKGVCYWIDEEGWELKEEGIIGCECMN